MRDYYLQTWYIPIASGVAERLKISEVRKYQENDSLVSSLPAKTKVLFILAPNSPRPIQTKFI